MKELPPRPFRHDAGPLLSKCAAWLRQGSDRSRPALGRIEAVESLAKECLDSQIFHGLAQLVDDESDDITVRIAIVLALPRWGDAPSQVFAIVRALSLPGVRPAVLKALDRIGQATGVRESRLLAELGGLRNGFTDPSRVYPLLKIYGRDRRVLDYLGQRLQNGNRWERALAASALLGLGEIATALRAALDLEVRVRNSLRRDRLVWGAGWLASP